MQLEKKKMRDYCIAWKCILSGYFRWQWLNPFPVDKILGKLKLKQIADNF